MLKTAAAVTAGALALGGVALLVPHPASASSPEAVVAAADSTHSRLITPEQRRQLRTTGHIVISKHTRKHGTVTVLVQRGTVDAVTPSSITLTSKDGYVHSYAITPKTKVREKGQPVALSELKTGERAMVIALRTKDGDNARRISCLRSAPTT